MTERDWRIFREDFDIFIKGGKPCHPIRKWKEGNIPETVLRAISDLKFDRPSPIQMQCIPIGLKGRDIIGIAETGSGKTCAFIIPIISYIYALPPKMIDETPDSGPLALVMAPTRELAIQIEKEAIKLCKYTSVGESVPHPITTVCIVGGQDIDAQSKTLANGVEVVIGTPGRIMDCLERRYLVLNQCNYVVLDEADRMIDMGFEEPVEFILGSMGGALKSENAEIMEQQLQESSTRNATSSLQYRVTTMFSATMPVEVERLAKTFLRHPVIVKIGDENSGKNKRIVQNVMFIHVSKKPTKLLAVMSEMTLSDRPNSDIKVIVFVNQKKHCDAVAKILRTGNYSPTVLHGGKSQDEREKSLNGFRNGDFDVLVATDVAGRGLDIPDVTHIVNYDIPNKIENYCHRIGRTGRAGKEGIAISFVTENDTDVMYDLKQYLKSTDAEIPRELANHPAAKAAVGTRDDRGKLLVASKKDTKIFTN